jgi:hypothetical protein
VGESYTFRRIIILQSRLNRHSETESAFSAEGKRPPWEMVELFRELVEKRRQLEVLLLSERKQSGAGSIPGLPWNYPLKSCRYST